MWIGVPPGEAFDLISDVTRTGEWSPECTSCEWVDGATAAAPGARFVGHNQIGSRTWDMPAVVDVAEPGRSFQFHTERNGEVRTRWGFEITEEGSGTRLTQWYERVGAPPVLAKLVERLVMGGRKQHNARNMEQSLARIKALLEAK
jgi:carbon monoxide dehydrogenase subunit G